MTHTYNGIADVEGGGGDNGSCTSRACVQKVKQSRPTAAGGGREAPGKCRVDSLVEYLLDFSRLTRTRHVPPPGTVTTSWYLMH